LFIGKLFTEFVIIINRNICWSITIFKIWGTPKDWLQSRCYMSWCGPWDHYSIHEALRREVLPFSLLCGPCFLARFSVLLCYMLRSFTVNRNIKCIKFAVF
jgi:hypothetical protein